MVNQPHPLVCRFVCAGVRQAEPLEVIRDCTAALAIAPDSIKVRPVCDGISRSLCWVFWGTWPQERRPANYKELRILRRLCGRIRIVNVYYPVYPRPGQAFIRRALAYEFLEKFPLAFEGVK